MFNTIMNRKAAEFWWNISINGVERKPFKAARNVAYYEKGVQDKWIPVTWDEVHKKRGERIKVDIINKRCADFEEIKPCLVWVFYVDSFMMGGYYCVIKTLKNEYYLNFRGERLGVSGEELRKKVMLLFPFFLPMEEFFNDWMIVFAEKFQNKDFYKKRKVQGVSTARCVIKNGHLVDILPVKYRK